MRVQEAARRTTSASDRDRDQQDGTLMQAGGLITGRVLKCLKGEMNQDLRITTSDEELEKGSCFICIGSLPSARVLAA